jgi:hypothetical protein
MELGQRLPVFSASARGLMLAPLATNPAGLLEH